MRAATIDDAIRYAHEVSGGKIPAGELVRMACERFLHDLEDPPEGYDFDEKKARRALRFIQLFQHTKGHMAGEPFFLQPWQAFTVCNVFGFTDTDGFRRFTKCLLTVGRKNGKSTFAAAVMLYMTIADGEPAAECYTAATKLEQSRIIFDEAYRMAEDSDLKEELRMANNRSSMHITFGRSTLKPLTSQDKTLDGLNPHACAIDEYHAHRNDNLFNVLLTGMGARRQPLMFTVTTAGFDKQSPARKYQDYCEKVLRGQLDDPNTWALIYTIDPDDDWKDEAVWQKANPNWGVSVFPKKLRQDFREALEMGHKEVEFKTKYLNVWTDSAIAWISDKDWMRGAESFTPDELKDLPCYAGLDLASTGDFTAFIRLYDAGEKMYLLPTFFIPEDTATKRTDGTGDAIREWVRAGLIHTTPGNVTDYRYIVDYITQCHAQHPIQSIAFDDWNSTQPVAELMEQGLNMAKFRQGYRSMSAPTKEIERLAKSGRIIHGGNPVFRWQMGNVMITQDPALNVKIDKAKSGDKVDGPVALAMAIGEWMDSKMREKPAEFWSF